jgi:hypothetical protein
LAQSESEVRKNADELFEKEAYVEATPLYLQLLNLYPKDAELNFKYGTCSLFNGDRQKKDALKFLNAATQTPTVDPRAFYFKGKALHLNYQFDQAKRFYKIYQGKRSAKDERYDVDREIEMCQNGKKLMIQFTDIIVSEKTQIEDDKFFRLYKDMKSIGGDILVTERFQSKIDKRRGHIPIVLYPKNAQAVYYSSYGDNGKTGLDIYVRKKLPNNSWGEPYKLRGDINTEYDEDFPYLHPNGRYLYFSSKGHNSMGGFDIFLARLNPANGQFQGVENVDFAICSPDDDLFYVVDSAYQNAYFASSRQSEEGKLHVYRVKVVRIPIQEVIVMGDFASEINPDNKDMTVNVTSVATGSDIGKFVTNNVGKYSFVFPKGGKYNFEIKIEGLEPITQIVELPFLDEFRPLKQKVVHFMENGTEKVKIIDLFDEAVEGGSELIAQVLREKSNLEVNINEFDIDELRKIELEAKRDVLLTDLGFQGMTVREVQNQLNELAEADTKKAEQIQKLNAGISDAYIGLSEEIENLTSERDALITEADNETDPAEKYTALLEAQRLDIERTKLLEQAEGLIDLSTEVKSNFGNDEPGNGEMSEVEAEFNRLVDDGKEEEALNYLAKQNDVIQKSKSISTDGMVEKLIQETIDQRKHQNEIAERSKANNREIEIAKARKVVLESKLPNARKKEATQIKEELAELDNTIKLFGDEQKFNQKKIVEIDKDISILDAQVEMIQSSGKSVLKEIDKREFEDAQAAIKAQKAKDRADELSNQLAQIENNNPETTNTDPTVSSTSETDKLINAHSVAVQGIESMEGGKREQIEALLTQNEQTLNSIQQELREIEDQLLQAPEDEKLIEDQAKLSDFKAELEDKQSDLAEELKALEPTTSPALTRENVMAEIAPNHASTQKAIESDLNLTEIERLGQLQESDISLRSSGEERLTKIQNELANDPTNVELLQELELINNVLFDTNKAIEDRANRIDEIENQTPDVAITKEDVIAELIPDYASTQKAIESDLSLTEIERLEQLQENDQSLQNSGEERLTEIQNKLTTDPTNVELLQELGLINDVLFDTNKGIEDRAGRIEEIENQTPDVAITKEDVIAGVFPNYQDEMKGVQSNSGLNEIEQLEAMNKLDQTLEASIQSRVNKVVQLLELTPSDTELQGEKQILADVLVDLSRGITKREADIAALGTNEIPPFNLTEAIASVLPNYETDIAAIEANEELSEKEKLEQKQVLDTELISNLNEQLETVQNDLASDPINEKLKIQEEGLKSVIDETQTQIDERIQTLNALNGVSLVVDVEATKRALIGEIKVDYEDRLTVINESSVPEVQRNLNRLEFEQEILSALVDKQKETQTEIENDPENEQVNAELDAVEQLIAEQKQTVEEQRRASLIAAKSAQVYEETVAAADRKYSIEIGDLLSDDNPSSEKIAAREIELQERLQSELEKKEKSLERKYSVDVDLETMILANEIEDSKQRQLGAENATNVVTTPENSELEFVADLRKEFMSVESLELKNVNPRLGEAQDHEAKLRKYQSELKTKKSELEEELESSPDDETLKNQLAWVSEEENSVETELRRMEITIGELESLNMASRKSPENDAELRELETKRSDLEVQLNDPNLSSSERKTLDNELEEVNQAALKRTNDIQSEEVVLAQEKQDNLNNALQQLGTNDPQTTEVKSAIAASEEERKVIESLLVQSDNAKSEEERNYLLSEAELRQDKLNTRLARVVENREIQNIEDQEVITLLSREELEKRKRGFIIEIGELEVQKGRVENRISEAKKKEIPVLNEEKTAIDAQLKLLKNQLEHIEARIENFNVTEPVDRMATVGLDQKITFSEERKIASTDVFKNYREEGIKALEIENELRNFQQDLDRERTELVQLLGSPKSVERDDAIELKTSKVKELEATIQELNTEFNEQMSVADGLLPDDEEEAMKIKNLLVRGVQPIKTAVIATALIQMPTTGFAIDETAESIYTEANPIPVGVKSPTGLTYRVQVGAFSRPIPQDLFKEFNPVSGEKIGNTGITRYMAGFFNSSSTVIDARQSIRSLGYSDAFVVAYCDGERISFGQARRLEASGECVPKGTNELILEVAENTADHLGIPTVNELVELPEYSYNQAPGAAEADPIELKQGLFFTVQIGVFNRPVDDVRIKNLPEILTVRLPNGLIRYATGMFDSSEEASPRRREAINKGITDAFIVAYFKGERLTVGKARKVLEENGPSILQSNIEKNQPSEVVEIPDNAQRTDSVTTQVVETTIAVAKMNERKVQIVTKLTFEEYPRDVLNRYNTEGNFYYDEDDGKVKSEIYSSKRELPRLFKFENDIDTVYLSENDVQNELDKKHVLVKLSNDKVPGDLADWLLRMGYQKKFKKTNEGLELHIEGIEPNGLQDVQYRIREVGLEPFLVELSDEKVEE